MEITKEFIVENINQALRLNGYELDKQELILLDKVVEKNYDDIACWRYGDYHYFVKSVLWEDFINALKHFGLIDRNDLDFVNQALEQYMRKMENEMKPVGEMEEQEPKNFQ